MIIAANKRRSVWCMRCLKSGEGSRSRIVRSSSRTIGGRGPMNFRALVWAISMDLQRASESDARRLLARSKIDW